MDGAMCHASLLDLYSVSGEIRLQLLSLIAAEKQRQATAAKAAGEDK